MKKKNNKKLINILGWIWSFFQIVIILYVILITVLILNKNKYGYTQFGKYTLYNVDQIGEKNNSKLIKGELVVFKKNNNFKRGDNIYYYSVVDSKYEVNNGNIFKIQNSSGNTWYILDGGNVKVLENKLLGISVARFPFVGELLVILYSKLGFVFFVLLPILIVFIYQVYDFVKIIHEEKELARKREEEILSLKKDIDKNIMYDDEIL